MKLLCKIQSVAYYHKNGQYLNFVTFKEVGTGKIITGKSETEEFPKELLEPLVICTFGKHLGDFPRKEWNNTVKNISRYEILDIIKFTPPKYADNSRGEDWMQ